MTDTSDKKYLTQSQKNELVQLVGDNYSVLFNRKKSDASSVLKQNEWLLISLKLNAIGPFKNTEGWIRCFTTLKAAAKAKYIAGLPLNDVDYKIVRMCNMEALDISSEQLKKARKTAIRKEPVMSQLEEGCSSNQISAAPQIHEGTSSNQVANIPIEEMGSYATTAQKRRLVMIVADNYSALFGKISTTLGAGSLKDRIWALLTVQLNSLGPKKDVKGWQNCFNYLKSKTKEKLTFIRQHKMRYGVSPTYLKLSTIESEIVEMCDVDTLDGNAKVVELGLKDTSAVVVNRVRPSSTIVSSMIPPTTINENASNDINGQDVDDSEQLTEALPDGQRIDEQEIQIESIRSLQDFDESAAGVVNETPSYDSLMADAAKNEILFERSYGETRMAREEILESDLQATNSMIGSRSREVPQSSQDDLDMEIRPMLEQPPQRRGVEINNNRYVRPRRQSNDEEDNDRHARRNRLSVPLGRMAEESLDLQRKGIALLTELMHLFRNRNES